ncbi:TOBE domain-containing protein (plasmid) [Deinococcus taeanensis]|uniref:TOBE domain-containing protein n=1 Tax=Deinococcus taeanensis TaxID=2737050 RepID=UPI001CDBACED|nr:TOBE domain-containing protein [Deinococcus taeanensis]UBV44584.1 TOBE domain-containing protein [Deinococcus taeanensis]
MNFIPGQQRGQEVRTGLGVFQVGVAREGPVTLVMRPETMHRALGENAFQGEVMACAFAGGFQRVTLRAGPQTLVWHAPAHEAVVVGQQVTLSCPAPGCWTVPRGSVEHPSGGPT